MRLSPSGFTGTGGRFCVFGCAAIVAVVDQTGQPVASDRPAAWLPAFVRIGHVTAKQFDVRLVTERLAPPPCRISSSSFLHRKEVRRGDDVDRCPPDDDLFRPFDHLVEERIDGRLNALPVRVPKGEAVGEFAHELEALGLESGDDRFS